MWSDRFCGFQNCVRLLCCIYWCWSDRFYDFQNCGDVVLLYVPILKWYGFVASRAVWRCSTACIDVEVKRFYGFRKCDVVLLHVSLLNWYGFVASRAVWLRPRTGRRSWRGWRDCGGPWYSGSSSWTSGWTPPKPWSMTTKMTWRASYANTRSADFTAGSLCWKWKQSRFFNTGVRLCWLTLLVRLSM